MDLYILRHTTYPSNFSKHQQHIQSSEESRPRHPTTPSPHRLLPAPSRLSPPVHRFPIFPSHHHSTMVSASTAPPCAFFTKLPAELRNAIYELSFADDNEANAKINLLQAKPPSNALLLTCRQANQEGKEIYRDAFRKYWTGTNFVVEQAYRPTISCDSDESGESEVAASLSRFRDLDLENIGRLCVKWSVGSTLCHQKELVDPRGGWTSFSSHALFYQRAILDTASGHHYKVSKDLEHMREALSRQDNQVPRRAQLVRMIGPRGMYH